MRDIRLIKLADLLVNYSVKIKKGEFVILQGDAITEPLLLELYRKVLEAGGHPQIVFQTSESLEIMLKEGTDKQIQYVSPVVKYAIEKCDAIISLWGTRNTKSLSGVNPKKLALLSRSRKELNEIRFERESKGEYRWVGTMFPSYANAQNANMSLEEYEDFVFKSGHIDKENPIAEWEKISKQQQKIVDYLNNKKELHIVSQDTDLVCGIEGRVWVNCDGQVNFPDGEVFTGPIENKVNGHIRFSYPGIYMGKEIEDIRLEFKEGKVVKASASKGEDLLLALLDTDEGSRTLGEIAIGTNYEINKFTREMLFDEKIGGTVHAAIGMAIPETKAKNKSSIHWDMLCNMKDGGKIFADDELFYENGKFLFDIIEQ